MSSGEKADFKEINVERINIVDSNGTIRMALFNRDTLPQHPSIDGKPVERDGLHTAGIMFFNDDGVECGGLTFGSSKDENGKYHAASGLLFDQYLQDEVISIGYSDDNGNKAYGISLKDRPNIPLYDLLEKHKVILDMSSEERQQYFNEMSDDENFGNTRLFMGRTNQGEYLMRMADKKGKTKIRMMVDINGNPKVEMLDDQGNIIYSLPPQKISNK